MEARVRETASVDMSPPHPSSLKSLVDGYKQWSSSAPNLGKGPRNSPALPGFTSLMEIGKYSFCFGFLPVFLENSWPDFQDCLRIPSTICRVCLIFVPCLRSPTLLVASILLGLPKPLPLYCSHGTHLWLPSPRAQQSFPQGSVQG